MKTVLLLMALASLTSAIARPIDITPKPTTPTWYFVGYEAGRPVWTVVLR